MGPDLRLALLEVRHQGGGDHDGRVRTGGETDEQREGDVVQHPAAEGATADEQQRGHREEGHHRGVDGADQGAVETAVGELAVRVAGLFGVVLRGLFESVEDDDRVVQRIAEDGQQTDDRARGDLEADDGVDTDGDREVVDQGDQGGERHAPLEGDGEVDDHEHQEDRQPLPRPVGDLGAPARADQLGVQLLGGHAQLLGEGRARLVGLLGVQAADLNAHRSVVAERLHQCLAARGLLGHFARLLHRDLGGLGGEDGAALELHTHVEPPDAETREGQDGDEDGDGVPDLPPGHEVDADLAAVQPGTEIAEP